MTRRPKMGVRSAFRLAGMAILLWVVYLAVDVGPLKENLLSIPPLIVGLGLVLGFVRVGLMSLRWRILDSIGADETGRSRLSRWAYFRFSLVTAVFSLFLPGVFGADAARAAWVVSEVPEDRARRVIVILFDRMLGFFSVLVLGFGAGLVAPGLNHRRVYLFLILGLTLGLVAVLTVGGFAWINRRLMKIFGHLGRAGERLGDGMREIMVAKATFINHRFEVGLAFFVCFLVHLVSFVLVYLAAEPLGIPLPFTTLALMTSLSWVALLIPFSIGGLGLRELSFVALLAPQGIGANEATAISLFQFGILVLVGLIGIPILFFSRTSKTRQ